MKLRAIVCVCIAGAAALRSPRKGVVGRDRILAASSGDERSAGRAEVGGLDQREVKERVINGVPVLTAAHCVDEPNRDYPGWAKSVVIGALDLTKWRCEWNDDHGWYLPERIDVEDIVIPDEWYTGYGAYDIALLHLARPSKLPPVKLVRARPSVGEVATLIGWGLTSPRGAEEEEYTDVLQRVEIRVLDDKDCGYWLKDEVEICAGDPEDQQSSNSGDSGGPLLVVGSSGEYFQAGVVSRGAEFYTLFADVAAWLDWIDETMDNWEPKTCEDQSSDCDARCCPAGDGVHDLAWNHDGADKNYDGMQASCEAKGARLCTYDELCPSGAPHSTPVGGQQANKDMWAPILPGSDEGTQNWVQVGTRDGGMCRKHTDFVGKPHPSGNWWDSTSPFPARGSYACCDGRCSRDDCNNFGRMDGGVCVGHWSAENCRATCGLPCSTTPEVEVSPKCEGAADISASTSISIFEGRPDTPQEVCVDEITVDKFDDESGGEVQALLKFDLSGYAGCNVAKAVLRLRSIDPSAGAVGIYRMTKQWNRDITWSSFGGGVGASDREADATFTIDPERHLPAADVTEDVKFWLDAGGRNDGWCLLNPSSDRFSFASSIHEDKLPRLSLYFVSEVCEDKNPGSCVDYTDDMADDNGTPTQCNLWELSPWLAKNCAATCGLCSEEHENCEFWARIGECQANPGYMLEKCANACYKEAVGALDDDDDDDDNWDDDDDDDHDDDDDNWDDDDDDNWDEPTPCVDDLTTTDTGGDDCSWYDENPEECGCCDDDDFTASEQCCACGGGVRETLTQSVGPKDASKDASSKESLAVVISVIFAVCLAVGVVAALLSKRCFYPTKQADSSKPRKIIIELPAAPSSGQATAPAEDDEEQPDVITN